MADDLPDGLAVSSNDEIVDLERVVEEILDDVDTYLEGEGPEGPWYYKSLTVTRKMNRINVYDVDGQSVNQLLVPDLSDHPDPHKALRNKLDDVNEETLDEL